MGGKPDSATAKPCATVRQVHRVHQVHRPSPQYRPRARRSANRPDSPQGRVVGGRKLAVSYEAKPFQASCSSGEAAPLNVAYPHSRSERFIAARSDAASYCGAILHLKRRYEARLRCMKRNLFRLHVLWPAGKKNRSAFSAERLCDRRGQIPHRTAFPAAAKAGVAPGAPEREGCVWLFLLLRTRHRRLDLLLLAL